MYNGAKDERYGAQYGPQDRIRVRLNFTQRTLEFFKNDVYQGQAFTNIAGK